jgi:hypothetical protein
VSDSLPEMTAAPGQFRIGDATYRIAPLSFAALGELELWVNKQFPDPKQVAKEMIEAGLPESIAEKVAMEAFRVARQGGVRVNSPEAAQVLASPAGAVQVLWLALRKHHPDLKEPDVARLIDEIEPEEYRAIESFVYGEKDDPKAATGAEKKKRPSPGGRSSTS